MLRLVYGCTMERGEVELALKNEEIWEAMKNYPEFVLLNVPDDEREEFNDDDFVIGYDVGEIPINKCHVGFDLELDLKWVEHNWDNFKSECYITKTGCMITVFDKNSTY